MLMRQKCASESFSGNLSFELYPEDPVSILTYIDSYNSVHKILYTQISRYISGSVRVQLGWDHSIR